MKTQPLVSVICLCYNHARYVAEALQSVKAQDYPHIELIIVDDASTDGSQQAISHWLQKYPETVFISLKENRGNCYAFNQGLVIAKGEWIIDLAADDMLLPQRISSQITFAQTLPDAYGVLFSDAWLVDANGQKLSTYYQRNVKGKLLQEVPNGAVYPDLLKKAFICTPTMTMRKTMLMELGGYDESLSYEDYDLWVRSGKHWKYGFQDEVLTKKRILATSHRTSFYKKRSNQHLTSTLKVCQKALTYIDREDEKQALAISIRYHLRQSLWMECFDLVPLFFDLLMQLGLPNKTDRLLVSIAQLRIPLFQLYKRYLAIKKKI